MGNALFMKNKRNAAAEEDDNMVGGLQTAYNSASNAILNCKAPKTPHYSLVQRASRAPVGRNSRGNV
jgi:dihydroorotate dehydrogenase